MGSSLTRIGRGWRRTFLRSGPTGFWIRLGASCGRSATVIKALQNPAEVGAGLLPKQLADAMGYSLEVHMGNDARFMTRDLASAFQVANERYTSNSNLLSGVYF